jgi:hypothetical protein
VVASDDPEKAYLEAYAVARQAADAVDGLVGKIQPNPQQSIGVSHASGTCAVALPAVGAR